MHNFEKNELERYTPCNTTEVEKLSLALAIIHIEFIIIHPFREGNGRISRLIASLMGLQGGYPPLNFSSIDDKKTMAHKNYINAIHSGFCKNYDAMQSIFKKILDDSMKSNQF
jgi:cell filamentation protein